MRLGIIVILITISPAAGEDRIFRTNPAFILGTEANRTASVRLGDLDGDGDLDAVLAEGRHWPQQNRILFNDGSGAFPLARNLGDELDTSYATELGDLDNDGDLDIAVGNDRTRRLVFLNNGEGGFSRAGVFGALRASTRSLTLHDLNGDGFLDILITNRGQPNRICFNDGQAGFAKCAEFGSSKDSTIDVAVADIDADGDPDLALANRDGQPNFVLLNDGAGDFSKRIPFGSGSDETRAVALADMNGDGRLDIVTANIGQPNGVYLADGNGGFGPGVEFGAAKGASFCLGVADMDRDGDTDIVIGNAGQTNAVYFNSGTGDSHTQVSFGEEDHVTYGLDLGDVNDDGFPDIAVANSDARNMIYFNLPASMAGRNKCKSPAWRIPVVAGRSESMTTELSRRDFSTIALGAAASGLTACGGGTSPEQADAPEQAAAPERNYDRCMGAFLGAAIADAIGGPPECQHAARIKKLFGEITGFVEYKKPPSLFPLQPGYALHATPGSVTDDTFIRMDITRFYLATEPPRTPAMLAEWLLANADFTMWWPPAVKALKRIESGEVTAEDGGLTHTQGGGGAWWTPAGILHAGNPPGAAAEVRNLCRPWKAPLERDIIGAIHAGTAESIREGASPDSVIDTVINSTGPLARKLFTRAAEIARAATSGDDLVEQLYRHCLVKEVTTEVDGPMPEPAEYLEYSDRPYTSGKFAEQQPLALAAFVYTKGHPRDAILRAVMNGRDADSIASNVGGWVGGLYGESGLPKEWVETVVKVNMVEMDLRKLGEDLLKVRV